MTKILTAGRPPLLDDRHRSGGGLLVVLLSLERAELALNRAATGFASSSHYTILALSSLGGSWLLACAMVPGMVWPTADDMHELTRERIRDLVGQVDIASRAQYVTTAGPLGAMASGLLSARDFGQVIIGGRHSWLRAREAGRLQRRLRRFCDVDIALA